MDCIPIDKEAEIWKCSVSILDSWKCNGMEPRNVDDRTRHSFLSTLDIEVLQW